jgi:hypothetical protein
MKVFIPDGVIAFAREFSRFKTPEKRTQGWNEQPHEVRGEGDVLDTIGTLMLWRYLREHDVPTTYLLTGGQGDDADLQVKFEPSQGAVRTLNINVKTSKHEWQNDTTPCARGHLTIKKVEFEKDVFDIYAQVFVHLQPPEGHGPPHVHLCSWIGRKSKTFTSQEETEIPNTAGERGFWIPLKHMSPMGSFSNL